MRRLLAHGLAMAFLVASLGAAQGPHNSEATPARARSIESKPEIRKQASKKAPCQKAPYQVGTASWYGSYFDGKPTASGEAYDMHDLTAAHPTLPLVSYVRVTNLRNGRAVVVRVNDRGPIVQGRIIDLSYGAAQVLQFQEQGLQRVRLDVVKRGSRPHVALLQVAYSRPVAELP
jgi:rare lipoprotein A